MKKKSEKLNVVKENRIGRFTVAKPMIEEMPDKLLRSFFGRFVIVRAEFIYNSQTFDYVAYSEYFDKRRINEIIPLYDLHLTQKNGQIINIRTVKHEGEKP